MGWVGHVVAWDAVSGTPWEGRCAAVLAAVDLASLPGSGAVLLDERCPGLTADDVRRVVAASQGRAACGVRWVTDTVKALEDGFVGPTVDRDGMVAVCSPVVVPGGLSDGVPADLVAFVAGLALLAEVVHVEVPGSARRLADAGELRLLEA